MRLFDTHCHLDDERFDEDRSQLIEGLPEQGLDYCVTAGSDLSSSRRAIDLAHQYDHIYAAAGVHPHEAAKAPEDYLMHLRWLLKEEKVVALGEIGLDYFYDFSPRDLQKRIFSEQLDLAYDLGLPVILHVRDAHGDMTNLLRSRRNRLPGGVFHCFSGSAEVADEYVKMGFYISFAGPITFKNAGKLLLAVQSVPDDRILIETDSPYLAPVPMRGKRNNPAFVKYVCQRMALLRGVDEEEMSKITYQNALRFFNIKQT